MKIHKGTFSDMKEEQEYDVEEFKILPGKKQFQLVFIKDNNTKQGKTIGQVKINLTSMDLFARHITNYKKAKKIKNFSKPDFWKDYFENTKSRNPSDLLVKAQGLLKKKKHKLNALDLGSGTGIDTKYLIEQNFRVTAIELSPSSFEYLKKLPKEDLSFVNLDFAKFKFPKSFYHLVNAQYSLPFISPSEFTRTFKQIKTSLIKGGVFTGNLFGLNDEWNQTNNMTFLSKPDIECLLSDLHIYEFQESEYEAQTDTGKPKHWHVFNIIAQK